MLAQTQGLEGKDFTNAVVAAGEAMTPPVRRVRIVETLSVIPITDKQGKAYKAYKGDGNYCYDIFADAKGRWTGEVISSFDANQQGFDKDATARPDGTHLILRLRKDDMLRFGDGDTARFYRVVKFTTGNVYLAEHHEAGNLKERDASKEDPFKYLNAAPSRLQKEGAVPVRLTASGQIFNLKPDHARTNR